MYIFIFFISLINPQLTFLYCNFSRSSKNGPAQYFGTQKVGAIFKAWLFCGGKYRRNSIENDYCGGKPGFSPLPLILTLTITLNLNPKDLTDPNPNPTDPTYPNQPTTNPSLPPQ